VGFFFASKRKKRPNWALFWKLRFYEEMVVHSFSAQKSFKAIFRSKIGTPQGKRFRV